MEIQFYASTEPFAQARGSCFDRDFIILFPWVDSDGV